MRNKAAKATTAVAALTVVASLTIPADASILWISDTNGNIGQVDTVAQNVVAGSVHNTQLQLTDIAFDNTGQMYGTTFTALYALGATTGAASQRGTYVGETGMNSLLGTSTGLLGASFADNHVYNIGANNAALTIFTNAPSNSAGDMAIANGVLYGLGVSGGPNTLMTLSGANAGTQATIHCTLGTGCFGQTFADMFGLADDGTTLYGVDGQDVYSINPVDGSATRLFNWSAAENGQNLGPATGAAFVVEGTITPPGPPSGVPEPASLGLLGIGMIGLAALRQRR